MTRWKNLFGSLESMAEVVAQVLRKMEAAYPGDVYSQAAVKGALAVRLEQLHPTESHAEIVVYAQNIVAHIHARWSKEAGLASGAKLAAVPDPVVLKPPWLHSFTAEWRRQPDNHGKWALVRRRP